MLIPLYLLVLICGFKKGLEVWPACIVSGGSFAIAQWATSNYLGPMLPDIIASLAFIILSIFVAAWSIKPIKEALDHYTLFKITIPDPHNMVIRGGKSMAAVFNFNLLSAAGSAILLAGLLSIPVMGASFGQDMKVLGQNFKTLK